MWWVTSVALELGKSNGLEDTYDRCQGCPLHTSDLVIGGNLSLDQYTGTQCIQLSLPGWTSRLQGHLSRVQFDKAMAETYIIHQGGARSLAAQREEDLILVWAELHSPAMQDWQVDFLSCQHLDSGMVSPYRGVSGPLLQVRTLNVKLLVSRFNNKLSRVVSSSMDPLALAVDVLVIKLT